MDILMFDMGRGVEAGVTAADAAELHFRVVLPQQTHSCNVAVADGTTTEFPDTDALVCCRRGIAIGVRTADCVPLLLYSADIGEVAAVHAGWRGTLGGIVSGAVEMLCAHGADPARMRACFGPSICGGCYEVGEDMAVRFEAEGYGECVLRHGPGGEVYPKPHIDLVKVNVMRLLQSGLLRHNVVTPGICTMHGPARYHSYRRDATAKRNISFIRLL